MNVNYSGCQRGLHPFKVVADFVWGNEAKVVRWCPKCRAIVVDLEVDGKLHPGYYKSLEYPEITKQHSEVIIKYRSQKENPG